MNDSSSFGDLLRRRRRALGLTQVELAERVGCAVITIQKIEAGERHPSYEIAGRMADQLEIADHDRAAFLLAARTERAAERQADPSQQADQISIDPVETGRPAGGSSDTRSRFLPSGTVTFLFSDIEGSSRLWDQHPQAMQAALIIHDAILYGAVTTHGGVVFKTTGDGFNAAFASAAAALAAALAAQRALAMQDWGILGTLRVRMALHTGMAEERDGDYFGPPLNRLARLLAAGHGGQILLSHAVVELLRDQLLPELTLYDLGTHRLRDLTQPEHVFQIVAPDLPADFPPLKTLDRQLGDLPAQPTPFIGRDTERMLLRVLLRRADMRLLTLSGPGGAGKTRLALQAAAELRHEFADGVAFVGLGAIGDPALVIPTIAKALGVVDDGNQPLRARLRDALCNKQCLLVLDNFEHMLAAAPDIAELLTAAPDLKVLATSRAVLHIAWEREFPVPPLAVPNRGMLPSVDVLQQYDAIMLFVTRAQIVHPEFTLTEASAPAVVEICRRLDGLPLAIELAAARSKLFSPPALLMRLEHPLSMLTGGPHDLPARQRTLRAAIDWSYNLLDDREQALFGRLGVFVNGCTIELAEAVCGDWRVGVGSWDDTALTPNSQPLTPILDGLVALADKSLLRQVIGLAGEPRFVMLETIREYALERLTASGEWAAARRRHAEVFLALAETAAAALEGAEQGVWLSRLEQEHDNLRAALGWAVEHRQAALGLRLATALRLFWFIRGYLTEGREQLAQILALEYDAASVRAQALDCAGFLARYQGDYVAAAALVRESLALWRRLEQRQGIADALSNLGYVMLHQGDYPAARALYEESLALNYASGNAQGRADCLSHLGVAAFYQDDAATAQRLHEESLEIWRALGDIEGVAYALYHLGDVALSQSDGAAALRFTESLAASVELGWPWGIVSAVEGAAGFAALHRRPQAALRLAGFAAQLRSTIAIPLSPAREQVIARRLEPARKMVDEATGAAAWAAGEALALEQAVYEAFAELAGSAAVAAPPESPAETFGGLTAREREVAALVAEGQANREIAATLVVGVKTVEAHVSHILTKLGFSSRAQIAAWAVANGLARAPQDVTAQMRTR